MIRLVGFQRIDCDLSAFEGEFEAISQQYHNLNEDQTVYIIQCNSRIIQPTYEYVEQKQPVPTEENPIVEKIPPLRYYKLRTYHELTNNRDTYFLTF